MARKDQTDYLLTNTPEAQQQIKHIQQLLVSDEPENVELAYALLEGGGVPDDFVQRLKATKEHIILSARYNLTKVLDAIKELSLQEADRDNLEDWQMALPKMKKLIKLKVFSDDWGDFFVGFSENDHSSIESLMVRGRLFKHIPWNFGALASLRILIIRTEGTSFNPDFIGRFSKLEFLYIPAIEELPDSFLKLKSLKKLYCLGFSGTHLPNEIHVLSSLQTFVLTSKTLTSLPQNFQKLPQLRCLHTQSNAFVQPSGLLKSFPKTIEYLKGSFEISNEITEFTSLRYLDLSETRGVTVLPEALTILQSLEGIKADNLWGSSIILTLPDNIHKLSRLRKLVLWNSQIHYLPPSIGEMAIEELWVNELMYVPKTFTKEFTENTRWGFGKSYGHDYDTPSAELTQLLEDIDEQNVPEECYLIDIDILDSLLENQEAFYYHSKATQLADNKLATLEQNSAWLGEMELAKGLYTDASPVIEERDIVIDKHAFVYDLDYDLERQFMEYAPPEEALLNLVFENYNDIKTIESLEEDIMRNHLAEFYPQLDGGNVYWELSEAFYHERETCCMVYEYVQGMYKEVDVIYVEDQVKAFFWDEAYKDVLIDAANTFRQVAYLNNCSYQRFYTDNSLFAFANDDDIWDEYIDSTKRLTYERSLIEEGLRFFVI